MKIEKNTPVIHTPLHGHALIEASAGTGKTWTLTGILLRLLIEEGHEPRHIVATTFTRAAANEMRHRVHARVSAFQALLTRLLRAHADSPDLLEDDDGLAARIGAHLDAQEALETDPVNRHLLDHALQNGLNGFIDACRRTANALQQLDQMFIGTLDSLCQRWLHELAVESGIDAIRINTDPDAVNQLSHDHLRRHYQTQAQANAERFAAFYTGHAPDADTYRRNSRDTLNHGDAPFLPLPPLARTLPDPRAALHPIDRDDILAAQALIADLIARKMLAGGSNLVKQHTRLPLLFDALQNATGLHEDDEKLLDGLHKAMQAAAEGGNPFNKSASPDIRQTLADHPALQALYQAGLAREQRTEQLRLMRLHSLQDNSEHVRRHLGAALQSSGETTYGELLARLNATLTDNPALSRYLAHRYPVLLVDEAQDLNHAQTELLCRIYGDANAHDTGFWLLVGDPKQAIYRFRGSDVDNYTRLKTHIAHHATLPENFRSSPALIDTLNRYYDGNPEGSHLGDGIAYHAVRAANAERDIVMRDGSPVTEPVHWLDIAQADDEPAVLIRLITHLTGHGSRWLRRRDDGLTPFARQDILILARGNKDLQTIEAALNQAGIPSERQADQSLFAQDVAQEMGRLLAALVDPNNSAVVRRLLAGKFYGIDLAELDAAGSSDTLARFQQQLADAGARWAQFGLLAALQTLWRDDPWHGNIWTRLAAQPHPAKWRDLLDLRRLQEIIAAHEQPPRRFLDWWRIQLADPPTAEWALCLPLPGHNTVRLMTIHKAKGLQAPVVILAGMGKPQPRAKDAVQPLHRNGELRLATGSGDPDIQTQIAHENDAEARRLLYVALTRAEDLLFIATRQDRHCFPPLKQLREHNGITPEAPDTLLQNADSPVIWAAAAPEAPPRQNAPLPATRLRGWRKTSFTALASHIPADRHDLAVYDTLDLELQHETADTAPAAFPFAFPRGPQAGSFLHEALEKIRWTRRAHWHIFFQALIDKHHLPGLHNHLPDLQAWFTDILHSPLVSGATLAHLTDAEREMGFSLALDGSRPLPLAAISEHFALWGKTLPLPAHHSLYRYLRGEIDLVYRHNGRYHVLDYKSNHLGDHAHDYHHAAMTRAMDDHHYWLQAALYQIALHRLLKNRLPDYRPAEHLGCAEYCFIRAASPDNAYGHLAIDIPVDWLLHLDELLSQNIEK